MSQASPTTPVPPPAPGALSMMAVLGLVLGITGFCTLGLTGLVGLILGIIAISAINKSCGALRGQGLAISGIVVSIVSMASVVVVLPFMIGLMLPGLAKAQQNAMTWKEMAMVRQVAQSLSAYAADYGGALPPTDEWAALLVDYAYVPESLYASARDPAGGRAFAMNEALDGMRLADVAPGTVLLFEIIPGGPSSGGPELLPETPRSRAGYVICFADGHVEPVDPLEVDALDWE